MALHFIKYRFDTYLEGYINKNFVKVFALKDLETSTSNKLKVFKYGF